MNHTRVICTRPLLLVAAVLASMLALAGVARAEGFGEITRFGGPGTSPGQLAPSIFAASKEYFLFQPWHVLGVDSKNNEVFELEEYEEPKEKSSASTRFLRLQDFSSEPGSEGKLLASADIKVTLPSPGVGEEFASEVMEGIAVDPTLERLYFLVTEERGEEVTDESEGAAARLYAFKTTPNSKKELEPAPGTASGGVLAGVEKLKPESEGLGVPLLQPHGITVDPETHEVIIAAHVDTASTCEEEEIEPGEIETECGTDELANAADHYATQRIKENGELGERYVDTGNILKQPESELISPFAPGSPIVVGSSGAERTLTLQLVQPAPGTFDRTVAEFPALASGAAKSLALSDTSGVETGWEEVTENPEGSLGGSLTVAPGGSTVYGVTKIINEEEAGKPEALFAVSERSAETLQPIGWTGGQRPDASDSCVLEPGSFEGEHLQIAAGSKGDVFVLVPEYLREPPQLGAKFPTKDAIVEFGPGGKGCPAASLEKNVVRVGGVETTAPVGTGVPVTLSSFVKQGDALSATWKIENEATKATVTETQSQDQDQKPELVHTFTVAGKYKIAEEVKSDNLDTPLLTVTRSLVVEEKGEAVHITSQPQSKAVVSGGTAHFTASASGKPAPSPQWWVSSDGGIKFEEDRSDKGNKTNTLEISNAPEAKSGYEYYAVFSNGTELAKTETATLTVVAPSKESKPETKPETKPEEQPPGPGNTQTTTTPGGGVLPSKAVSPSATVASGSPVAVSSSGAVSLKVSCPTGATTCIGTVTLRTASAVSAASGKKKTVLTLATGAFNVSGGKTQTITLHLSGAARKLLAKLHVLHARASVAAHGPAGESASTAKLLMLHPAPAKHKH